MGVAVILSPFVAGFFVWKGTRDLYRNTKTLNELSREAENNRNTKTIDIK